MAQDLAPSAHSQGRQNQCSAREPRALRQQSTEIGGRRETMDEHAIISLLSQSKRDTGQSTQLVIERQHILSTCQLVNLSTAHCSMSTPSHQCRAQGENMIWNLLSCPLAWNLTKGSWKTGIRAGFQVRGQEIKEHF